MIQRCHQFSTFSGCRAALLLIPFFAVAVSCRPKVDGETAARSEAGGTEGTLASSTDVGLTFMSVRQLRDHIDSLEGKIVFLDLWALW